MSGKNDHWIRMLFKGNKVWVESDASGVPIKKNGKIKLKYRLDQDYEYRVFPQRVLPLNHENRVDGPIPATEKPAPSKSSPQKKRIQSPLEKPPQNAITLYTDGASSGNPGPAGIGVVLNYKGHEKEVSRFIGTATNNQAELEAIRTGVSEIKKADIPVRIYTDSSYAYGVLMLGWKAKKNLEMITDIRKILSRFKDLKIIHIKGHAGLEGNERADKLATTAITRGR